MTRPGPTPKRPYRAARAGRGLLAAFVGVLLVLAGIVVGAVPAAAQNRVGASSFAAANTVGPAAGIGAGQRLGNTAPQPQIVVATAVAADSADLAGTGVTRALTTSELRSVRSLEQRVAEHQAKLDAYRANPDAFDNLGILERAGTADIRQSIIDGRIRHLEGEISTFQDQIDKLLGGGQ